MNKKQKKQLTRREFNSIMLRTAAFGGAVALAGTGCDTLRHGTIFGTFKDKNNKSWGGTIGVKFPIGGGSTQTKSTPFTSDQADSIEPLPPAGATSWYDAWVLAGSPTSIPSMGNTMFPPSGYSSWSAWNADPAHSPPSGYSTWSGWAVAMFT